MARFNVKAVNDDRDFCMCCGKSGLKKVVWIEDTETSQISHFGTTCASSPAKAFGLQQEIKKAIKDHEKAQKAQEKARKEQEEVILQAALNVAWKEARETYTGEMRRNPYHGEMVPVDSDAWHAHWLVVKAKAIADLGV
jgi:hypothetical protein